MIFRLLIYKKRKKEKKKERKSNSILCHFLNPTLN